MRSVGVFAIIDAFRSLEYDIVCFAHLAPSPTY